MRKIAKVDIWMSDIKIHLHRISAAVDQSYFSVLFSGEYGSQAWHFEFILHVET